MGSVLIDLARGLGVAAGFYPGFAQSGAEAGSHSAPPAPETRPQWVVALRRETGR